jgi:putative serine protease PepD
MTQQGDRDDVHGRALAPIGWMLSALAAAALVAAACQSSGGSGSTAATAGSSTTAAADSATVEVVKAVGPSVVLIQTPDGLGSGEVYDGNGDIVTNAHVVGPAATFVVTTSAGKRLDGTLVGSFPPDDLAVIHVNGAGLKPARFGDSSKLQAGESVLAIGNPLGLEGSVTSGIVSALGRVVSEGAGGGTLPDAIQTSAPINPGNSGGALVNMSSEVVGIPTLAALSPGTQAPAPGIGFAISSNRAKVIVDQLVRSGRVTNSGRAYLGVQSGSTSGGQGALVVQVVPGGPAAQAGITAGSLIASVAGKPTQTASELAEVLATLQPGQTVPVAVVRPDGSSATVNVTLGQLPG